jgi:hypothetical protein
MLKQCRDNPSAGECHRRNRDVGARQIDLVGDYFVEVMCEQSLFVGFTSVLSGAIGPQVVEPEYFEDLTLAETQAVDPGADGTQPDGQQAPEFDAPPTAAQENDDQDAWRKLAFNANFQAQKLAEGMKRLNEADGDEEWAWTAGILSRILTLNEIVFFAARLYDGTPEEVGAPSLKDLRRALEGDLL